MLGWLALALVALALRRVLLGYPATSLPNLARREAALVEAAADAMFPPGGEIPESGVGAGIPEYADNYVASVPPRQALLMRALFFLMEHATLAFPAPGPRGWRRFSSLSQEQRVATLEGWRTSGLGPRRLVFLALRTILTMGYFACPGVLRRTGLLPQAIDTPVVEADLRYPPIGEPTSALRRSAADLTAERPRARGPEAPVHPAFRGDAS